MTDLPVRWGMEDLRNGGGGGGGGGGGVDTHSQTM